MPKSRTPSFSRNRHRWTAANARAALSALARSGLSPYAFAQREGLDPQRLYRWRDRLAQATVSESPEFIEVSPPVQEARPSERIELVLKSGCVLRLPDSFNAETLHRLVELLERAAQC
jgi:hypothetical protein